MGFAEITRPEKSEPCGLSVLSVGSCNEFFGMHTKFIRHNWKGFLGSFLIFFRFFSLYIQREILQKFFYDTRGFKRWFSPSEWISKTHRACFRKLGKIRFLKNVSVRVSTTTLIFDLFTFGKVPTENRVKQNLLFDFVIPHWTKSWKRQKLRFLHITINHIKFSVIVKVDVLRKLISESWKKTCFVFWITMPPFLSHWTQANSSWKIFEDPKTCRKSRRTCKYREKNA